MTDLESLGWGYTGGCPLVGACKEFFFVVRVKEPKQGSVDWTEPKITTEGDTQHSFPDRENQRKEIDNIAKSGSSQLS